MTRPASTVPLAEVGSVLVFTLLGELGKGIDPGYSWRLRLLLGCGMPQTKIGDSMQKRLEGGSDA